MKLTIMEMLVLEACKNATKEAPLTRKELKIVTHRSDRKSRDIIGSLRDKGLRIAHNNKGYWYANPQEYTEWINKYTAYAYTILERKNAMDRWTEGQMEMPDIDEMEGISDETTKIEVGKLSGY